MGGQNGVGVLARQNGLPSTVLSALGCTPGEDMSKEDRNKNQRSERPQEGRAISDGLERLLGTSMPVLTGGFVRVVDYMGNDASVVQAARVSYGQGTRALHEDRGLIRYL